MSLDFYLYEEVFSANITHNLNTMAKEAGLYMPLWRPEEMDGVFYAGDLIPHIEKGLVELKANPEKYKKFNPENGWGSYEGLVEFAEAVLAECRLRPNALFRASR